MNWIRSSSTFLIAVLVCSNCSSEEWAIDKIEPVFAIYSPPARNAPATLSIAVFGDGNVFWSNKHRIDGAEYRHSKIAPENALSLIRKAAELLRQPEKEFRSDYRVVDARYQIIKVRFDGKEEFLRSSHEYFEANLDVIVTSRGVIARGGRSLTALRLVESPEYLTFRTVWSDIRSFGRSATLELDNEKIVGNLNYDSGEPVWVTSQILDNKEVGNNPATPPKEE